VKAQTLILSGDTGLNKCELYTAQELQDYYDQPNPRGPVSEVPVYSLADTMNDDEYTETILLPYLIPKVCSLYNLP